MARRRIPDALERRTLVEADLAPERALAIAEAYLDEGREVEAVAFLEKAGARDRLLELQRRAIEAGDAFLLQQVALALGAEPDRVAWDALARAAEAAGKELYAQEARRRAEHAPPEGERGPGGGA